MTDPQTFVNARLNDATFENCAMVRTRFHDVALTHAEFDDVDLRGARFHNVNLAGATIDDANIAGMTIAGHDVSALIRQASGNGTIAAEPQLFVADIDAACRFYVDSLGFRVAFEWGAPPFYALVTRGAWRLNLRRVEGPVLDHGFRDREADALAATLTAVDAAAFFREFADAGVPFHEPLKTQPWGATTFILRDPDGNLIAVAGGAG